MQHTSVKLDTPIEFVNVSQINPLISRCQIKVCYVSDKPNRNRSVITKETATKMAQSLRGSPVVGYFNTEKGDFEEHNRVIEISNGTFDVKDTTFPYGFVSTDAKVWFQKFLDDNKDEREYLMTEGYIWTGIYPESQRVIDKGNNQSMELDDKKIDARWSKDKNGNPEFFIINEAIIKKLCILGEDCEPCFEGANITAPTIQFSFGEKFNEQMFSMMKDLKELLEDKGGTKVFTRFNVEIGDPIWTSLYSYLNENYPNQYSIEEICENEGSKFAVLKNVDDNKIYSLNFSLDNEFVAGEMTELTEYMVSEEPQFNPEKVAEFAENFAKKKDEKGKENTENNDNNTEDKSADDGKDDNADPKQQDGEDNDDEEKKKDKKTKYSLDDVVEYGLLKEQYDDLANRYNELVSNHEALEQKLTALTEFKNNVDREKKQDMINSFYMLSDEDKKDVIDNIDTYSLDDIEAKLSIICVRNKVSFDNTTKENDPTVYNLNNDADDDNVPAWIKAVRDVAKSMD